LSRQDLTIELTMDCIEESYNVPTA